jgi:hypothetical protein
MILAILQNISTTETLLNNLSEAEFNLDDISVMTNDVNQRNAIAKDVGPLKGIEVNKVIESLVKLKVSKKNAEICHEAIIKGKILVVMNIASEYSQAAEEMFQDHSAQLIKG